MKKIILSLISGLFLFSQTASAVGVNIGVSGTMGLFAASGSESQSDADGLEGTTKQEAREYGAGGWGSIFVEGTMGKLTLGVDYVSDVFSTETAETHKNDQQTEGSDSVTAGENRVQVDFEELTTIYASVALTDNFYVKGGVSTIDVITNEIIAKSFNKVNKEKNNKPFLLSLSYVSGLCIVYLFVGLFIGYSANVYNIQSAFQDPVYLIIFSILLVVLALSMFGFYEIKIFNILQNLISRYSSNLNISGYSGSFVMGLISALIVGPCVAPPLAGIFIYITAENPGFIITGLLFLSLSIGMSIPLLAYGTFIGKFVPKAGKWMKYINYLIGILLLLVALTFIDRLTPIFNFLDKDISCLLYTSDAADE